MFKKLLIRYLVVFVLFFAGFNLVNKYLNDLMRSKRLFGLGGHFWVLFLASWIITYFLFRPLVKRVLSREKIKEVMLWVVIPFSLWIPAMISQNYLQNAFYNLVQVEYAMEVLEHPDEKFFEIDSFSAKHEYFIVHKERYVGGSRSKSMKVRNYYIAPMGFKGTYYGSVAYGLVYSESISYGLITKKDYPKKVEEFNKKSHQKFLKEALENVAFFEKQIHSEDSDAFAAAWKEHPWLSKTEIPTILLPHKKSMSSYFNSKRNLMIFSITISIGSVVLLLFAFKEREEPK